jgi:hypothetical protein
MPHHADDTDLRPAKTAADNSAGSQLFLLRLWPEKDLQPPTHQESQDKVEAHGWRGKVQHVLRGEEHPFSDFEAMAGCLQAMLPRDLDEWARGRTIQPNYEQRAQQAEINRDNTGILC